MVKTMVKRAAPLQTVEVNGNAEIHLQPMEETHARAGGCLKEGHGHGPVGNWSRLLAGTRRPGERETHMGTGLLHDKSYTHLQLDYRFNPNGILALTELSDTSPDQHNLSKLTESGLAMMSTSSLSILWSIQSHGLVYVKCDKIVYNSILLNQGKIFDFLGLLLGLLGQISLQGLLSLRRDNSTCQFGTISKPANGAINSCIQLIDEYIEQKWT
ncbi:hypothetical protein BTVI_65892 [Pitangus sulphuratus]|nr:hypothetical protein BTVI_65892 [Pitangus sulphuratus]